MILFWLFFDNIIDSLKILLVLLILLNSLKIIISDGLVAGEIFLLEHGRNIVFPRWNKVSIA